MRLIHVIDSVCSEKSEGLARLDKGAKDQSTLEMRSMTAAPHILAVRDFETVLLVYNSRDLIGCLRVCGIATAVH